jgi:hypothetical protein
MGASDCNPGRLTARGEFRTTQLLDTHLAHHLDVEVLGPGKVPTVCCEQDRTRNGKCG